MLACRQTGSVTPPRRGGLTLAPPPEGGGQHDGGRCVHVRRWAKTNDETQKSAPFCIGPLRPLRFSCLDLRNPRLYSLPFLVTACTWWKRMRARGCTRDVALAGVHMGASLPVRTPERRHARYTWIFYYDAVVRVFSRAIRVGRVGRVIQMSR